MSHQIEKPTKHHLRHPGPGVQSARSVRRAWAGAARTYHILSSPTRVLCHTHKELKLVTDYADGMFTLECGCQRSNFIRPGEGPAVTRGQLLRRLLDRHAE